MTTLTPIIVLDSKPFNFDPVKCLMTAGASDCKFASTQRIWDNSSERGVFIRSRTGSTIPFILQDTVKDDGDVVAWKFRSADPDMDMAVVIYND